MRRNRTACCPFGRFSATHPNHLRYHVARALNDDGIAFADVLALDLVLVVQCRALHDDAADGNRLELCDRRQRAAPAHLNDDVVDDRLGLLRRKFMGEGPARRAAHEAQTLLEIEIVDLVDDAIDVVRQAGAHFSPMSRWKGEQLIDAAAEL